MTEVSQDLEPVGRQAGLARVQRLDKPGERDGAAFNRFTRACHLVMPDPGGARNAGDFA